MSKILIYSDPHLGLNRQANTSFQSSLRLRDRLREEAERLVTEVKSEQGCDSAFCLGDLFHKYSNSESVIESAKTLVKGTDLILAGNHDVENRADSLGSLQLLEGFSPGKFLRNGLGECETFQVAVGKTDFLFVPHVGSQELFEQALEEAENFAKESSNFKVLCLHCNYNINFEDTPDTTLNLTEGRAKELLSSYHWILLGHEHIPSEHLDGRVVIIGNTFPTGFSDISSKRVLVFDTDEGDFTSVTTWDDDSYSGGSSKVDKPKPFMDLFDDLPVGESSRLVTRLFKDPITLAIRLRTEQQIIESARVHETVSLPDRIREDLASDPELLSLWSELSEKV